jgi:alkylation response protein AidB-like acyl-CoA dehydrogenase
MNFAFSEEQDLLRSSTSRFLERRRSLATLRLTLEDPENFDRQAWADAAELGWTSMLIPESYGGGSVTDQAIVDLIVLGEELGRVLHSGPFVPTNVVADAIATWGSDALRSEWLTPIAQGSSVAAWCLSQDGSLSPEECSIRAAGEGGTYRLNGVARFVEGATVADVLLVKAVTDEGAVYLLVSPADDGVDVRTQQCIDLTRRFGEVKFDDVVVDTSRALGADSIEVEERAVNLATVLQAAQAVGAADQLFADTVAYLRERMQFGRTIASFQAIKHRIADMLISLEGMRAATHYAALALSDDFPDAQAAVSTAGSFVDETFAALCGESLQLLGGIGFTWEHDVHLYLRRALMARELYGEPSWHRERLCALAEAV